jgi:UDP-galactopyranose mutase
MRTLIVFSHLRWNFVYQRPQHLISRLAMKWRVIFIEEPVPKAERAKLERFAPAAGVEVWRPHVTGDAPGFHDDHLSTVQRLLANAMREHAVRDYWIWFYTPMALPFAAGLAPRGVVYDCMDELAAFKNPPKQLLQRETALLNLADLVFAGGPSLFEAKRERRAAVHCFPSSVDVRHFERARERELSHPLQHAIAHPRLGFFGVIDERFDGALTAALADAHPEWQLVLVGPVLKIDPASLPRRPNIHYMGQQPYADLPAFLAGWDVCLLPFARNDATKFISPTKTLEYMAAELPIVSTPITDVAEPYGNIVYLGGTPEEFIAACEAAMASSPEERASRAAQMRQVLAGTSWEVTVAAMERLLTEAMAGRTALRVPA